MKINDGLFKISNHQWDMLQWAQITQMQQTPGIGSAMSVGLLNVESK